MVVNAVRFTDDELVSKLRSEIAFDTSTSSSGLKPDDMITEEQVRDGKANELASIMAHDVFDVVDVPSGVKPTGTRWVLRPKNDSCKARIVVKDLAFKPDTQFYSPTPNMTSLRLLANHCAWSRKLHPKSQYCLRSSDVGTAFLNAPISEDVYVYPPVDIKLPIGKAWKLKKALYGLRCAPRAWFTHLSNFMLSLGFRRLLSDPSMFVRGSGKDMILALVYVDDILFSGAVSVVQNVIDKLSAEFILKTSEPLLQDGQSLKMLGRVITRLSSGFSVAGDFGVVRPSIVSLGLEGSKPVSTPAVREVVDADATLLSPTEHREFRRHVGRLNYYAGDRCDLKFAVKRLSQALAAPTSQDWTSMKRVFRYLVGRPNFDIICDCDEVPKEITVYVDSDWATDTTTRRSTSGFVLMFSKCVLHFMSKTQSTVALSSAEAELNAFVLALNEALYIKTLMQELDIKVAVKVFCDSSAAIQHLQKLGLGRLKHVSMKSLYVQDMLQRKMFHVVKVDGLKNIADILTKATDTVTQERLLASPLWKVNVDSSCGRKYDAANAELDVEVCYLRLVLSRCIDKNYVVL